MNKYEVREAAIKTVISETEVQAFSKLNNMQLAELTAVYLLTEDDIYTLDFIENININELVAKSLTDIDGGMILINKLEDIAIEYYKDTIEEDFNSILYLIKEQE